MIGNVFIVVLFVFCFLFVGDVVKADYKETCSDISVFSDNGKYRRCGTNIIYLYENDKKHSSYIISNNEYGSEDELLYAGLVEGVHTFYGYRFSVYTVVYDAREWFSSDENMWMDMTLNNVVVYNGKFEDNYLVDESSERFSTIYNEVGTYFFRQYKGSEIVGKIRVVIVDKNDYDLSVESALWGDYSLFDSKMIVNDNDMVFSFGGGKYGFDENIRIGVNECYFSLKFSKVLRLSYGDFSSCLISDGVNKVVVELSNGLNMVKSFSYKFSLGREKVSISLESTVSKVETSSRRIVISASAGDGNVLDQEHNLYYWSTNPDDKLTYEDFMINYGKSENKGNYTSDKGVILRNEIGTYYLYALAKDDESSVVVRSDEYILKETVPINSVNRYDVLFVTIVLVFAIIPIIVYLVIRGKDTL